MPTAVRGGGLFSGQYGTYKCDLTMQHNKCRLYHEVEVSTWFTHWGPEARGCVNHVETDTKWYNRLVPWATWPWQRIYILATIVSAINGSSAYLATVWTIVADCHRLPDIDDSIIFIQLFFLRFKTMLLSLCAKGRLLCRFQLIPDRYSYIPWQLRLRWIQSLHPYN